MEVDPGLTAGVGEVAALEAKLSGLKAQLAKKKRQKRAKATARKPGGSARGKPPLSTRQGRNPRSKDAVQTAGLATVAEASAATGDTARSSGSGSRGKRRRRPTDRTNHASLSGCTVLPKAASKALQETLAVQCRVLGDTMTQKVPVPIDLDPDVMAAVLASQDWRNEHTKPGQRLTRSRSREQNKCPANSPVIPSEGSSTPVVASGALVQPSPQALPSQSAAPRQGRLALDLNQANDTTVIPEFWCQDPMQTASSHAAPRPSASPWEDGRRAPYQAHANMEDSTAPPVAATSAIRGWPNVGIAGNMHLQQQLETVSAVKFLAIHPRGSNRGIVTGMSDKITFWQANDSGILEEALLCSLRNTDIVRETHFSDCGNTLFVCGSFDDDRRQLVRVFDCKSTRTFSELPPLVHPIDEELQCITPASNDKILSCSFGESCCTVMLYVWSAASRGSSTSKELLPQYNSATPITSIRTVTDSAAREIVVGVNAFRAVVWDIRDRHVVAAFVISLDPTVFLGASSTLCLSATMLQSVAHASNTSAILVTLHIPMVGGSPKCPRFLLVSSSPTSISDQTAGPGAQEAVLIDSVAAGPRKRGISCAAAFAEHFALGDIDGGFTLVQHVRGGKQHDTALEPLFRASGLLSAPVAVAIAQAAEEIVVVASDRVYILHG